MEEVFEEDLSKTRKLTPELKKQIRKTFLKNLLIAILIIIYMGILMMAFYKMELNTFELDLKVISVGFLSLAIIKFEQSYKKDKEAIFLVGVEALALALITLFMTALISAEEQIFLNAIMGISAFTLVYYMLKSLYIRRKIKKEHRKQVHDIRDIVQK